MPVAAFTSTVALAAGIPGGEASFNNGHFRGGNFEEITVEQDGQIYHFLGGEEVVTQRGSIFAKDLTEEDTLII